LATADGPLVLLAQDRTKMNVDMKTPATMRAFSFYVSTLTAAPHHSGVDLGCSGRRRIAAINLRDFTARDLRVDYRTAWRFGVNRRCSSDRPGTLPGEQSCAGQLPMVGYM